MKLIFTLLLALLAPTPAHAQDLPDVTGCMTTRGNPDLAIKLCTAAIDSRKFSGEALAGLHQSRGAEWANKGESGRAIEDFSAALTIKPGVPLTLHARGVEYAMGGDYARALADYDAAQKLDPQINIAFTRGRALFYMGNFNGAESAFEQALRQQPNMYTALWLFLARRHGGTEDAAEQLERDTRRLRAGWPAPLVAFYLGRTDARSIVNAATDTDPARQQELACEANFYMAHGALFKGDKAGALKLLESVRAGCAKNLLEYEGTIAELRRIK
jgi:lipoprotein NlpI